LFCPKKRPCGIWGGEEKKTRGSVGVKREEGVFRHTPGRIKIKVGKRKRKIVDEIFKKKNSIGTITRRGGLNSSNAP